MNKILKQYLPDVLVVLVFALMSFMYFYPADVENRVLFKHDAAASKGLGHEISEFKDATGETTRWTDALFSGMPTYQIAPAYDSVKPLTTVMEVYHLGLPEYVWYLFAYLLGFYILLRAFDFRWHLAALGSVLWALSSYFLIIIAAGHLWKVMALAYLPPMIGGVWLCYKGRYLAGFLVTALFAAMEVNANHVQMTYYYLFIILFLVVALFVDALREKTLRQWLTASGVCAAAAIVGVLINLSSFYHTYEYSKDTMRGKSELVKKNSAKQTDSGLDRDYITQWSYGGDELLTLMIPNANGGAHDINIGQNPDAVAQADPQIQDFIANFYQYWGEQPYTAGPVYVGALVVMLFILSLFIVKGPVKWALFGATILSILLSLGHNLQWFTDIFIDYCPMYSKFRTVSSILVIAEFTMPLLAMLALKRLYDEPSLLKEKKHRVYFAISMALTAGVCLFIAVFPDVMPHIVSQSDIQNMHRWGLSDADIEIVRPSLAAARKVVLTADCWRSFWIIITGAALILLYQWKKLNGYVFVAAVTVLCLFDMWQVDKRYLHDSMFVNVEEREAAPAKSPADEAILQDKSLGYRVLNLSVSTFNDNTTSYYHRSIGGYHAAKLRRYQELIDAHLMPEMQNLSKAVYETGGNLAEADGSKYQTLNMLNMRYLIVPIQNGVIPVPNPHANGVGWFVDEVKYVDDANGELYGMKSVDLRHIAVVDKSFKAQLGEAVKQDSTSMVTMTKYAPNHLEYDITSKTGGVAVFSEVYYPGWTATVDGQPVELGRVNYVLRALNVKAGSHKVVMDFNPASVSTTETIAYIASAILLLVFLMLIVRLVRNKQSK